MEELIRRINELAAKNRSEGLTLEEIEEREALRLRYRQAVTGNLRASLDNTYIKDANGNIKPLKER